MDYRNSTVLTHETRSHQFVVVRVLGVFLAAFGLTLLSRQLASAHTFPYRWASSTVRLVNDATSYANAIVGTVNDYDDNTDLIAYYGTSCVDYCICYQQADRGLNYPIARARGYRIEPDDSLLVKHWCNDTSGNFTDYCNTTSRRANGGRVYLNIERTAKAFIDAHAGYVMRHEAGHILGMGHGPCDEVSVMRRGDTCSSWYHTLTTHDINLMNSWY